MNRRFHRNITRLCTALMAAVATVSLLQLPAFAEEEEEQEPTVTVYVTDCAGNKAAGVSVIIRGRLIPQEDAKEEAYVAYAVTDKNGEAPFFFDGDALEATVTAGALEAKLKYDGSSDTTTVKIQGVHDEREAAQKVIDAATCTQEGKSELSGTCPDCGEKLDRTAIIAPLGHNWDEGEITREPTCAKAGVRTRKCTRDGCDATSKKSIAKVEHTPGKAVSENTVSADCTKPGSHDKVVYCTVCGEELNRIHVADPVTDHTPGNAETTPIKPAACLESGSHTEIVRCSICDEELSRERKTDPASGHTPGDSVKENETEATCTAKGSYEEVVYCTDCGEELSREEVIVDALGHSPAAAVKENEVKATCAAKGSYDEVVRCSRCGEEISRQTATVDAAAHTPGSAVKQNEKKATCTDKGSYDEVVSCTQCGAEISRKSITVAATGHQKDEAVRENEVEPTCTERGSYEKVIYCKTCGEEISRTKKTVPAEGHTEGPAVQENVVSATCKQTGSCDLVVRCTVCKAELSRTEKTLSTTGHTSVQDSAVPATCTTAGLSAGYHCEVCNATLVAQNTIPALGHKWDDGKVTTPATADKDGVMTFTCRNNPAHTRTEVIPKGTTNQPTSGGINDNLIGNGNGPLTDLPVPDSTESSPVIQPEDETLPISPATPEKVPTARKGTIGILNILLMLATIGISVFTFLRQSENRLRYAAPAPAVLAMLLFFVGQRFTGKLVFADLWSIPLLLLAATAGVLFFVVAGFGMEGAYEEEEEEADLSDFEEI